MDVFRVVHVGYQVENADGDVLATRRLKGDAIRKARDAAAIAAGTGVDAEVHSINSRGRVESKNFYPAVEFESKEDGSDDAPEDRGDDDGVAEAQEAAAEALA